MRSYEILTDCYIPISILSERFTDSEWLHDTISTTIKNYNTKYFNPIDFYSTVLINVFGNPKFRSIFHDFSNIPVYYDVQLVNTNMIIASTRFEYDADSIKHIILRLNVPRHIISNIDMELDSVLGHEINHMIQRIHQHKNKFYPPKSDTESDLINYSNDNHYITYDRNLLNNIKYYFLNIKEFDSHAYTYGMRLWHQYGIESKEVLKVLYTVLYDDKFNPSIDLKYDNSIIDTESVLGLYNFAVNFKNSEKHNILKNDTTALDLWNKLFSEIYKYIDTRIKL